MLKKLIIVFLSLIGLWLNVLAENVNIDGIYYSILSESKKTCQAVGRSSNDIVNIYIPSKVTIDGKEYSVVSIEGFGGNRTAWRTIKSLNISEGIKRIENHAFFDQTSLKEVTLPHSLEYIGISAFFWCPIDSIYLSDNITHIEQDAFSRVPFEKMTRLNLPKALKKLGSGAFCYSNSNIKTVIIQENVDSIGSFALGIDGLKKVIILTDKAPVTYDDVDRNYNPFSTEYGAPMNAVIYSSWATSYWCGQPSKKYEYLKNSFADDGVLYAPTSFSPLKCDVLDINTSSSELVIPSSVNHLNSSLLVENIVSNAMIGNNATITIKLENKGEIGASAFADNPGIESVSIGSEILNIGSRCFENCYSLKNVYYSNNLTSIPYKCFMGCSSLQSISNLSSSLLTIDSQAFSGCSSLEKFYTPSSVRTIGSAAFEYCSRIDSLIIPDEVKIIYDGTFRGCENLKYISLGNGVKTIGKLFEDCTNLEEISLGTSVTTIGTHAFENLSNLRTINIPSSCSVIESGAFTGCSNLQELFIEEGNNSIQVKNNTTEVFSIGNHAFSDSPIQDLWIGRNLSYESSSNVGYSPFFDIKALNTITISETVTNIGPNLFKGCENVSQITCYATTAPICAQGSLDDIDKSKCTLSIYQSCKDEYAKAEYWKDFMHVEYLMNPEVITEISQYKEAHAAILAKTAETVTIADKNAIDAALFDFNQLSELAQAELRPEKELLDALKVAIYGEADTDISLFDNVVYIAEAEGRTGSQLTLSIDLINVKSLTGFQCDLYLPEGASVVYDEYGYADATLNEARANSKVMSLDAEPQSDGSLRLLAYSSKNIAFTGNEGEVAQVNVLLSETMEDGEHPLILKNIVLTEASGQTIEIDYVKTTLTITSYMLGDANGDLKVNVGDLAATASHILGNTPESFIEKAADANEDGKINVGDLAKIAGIILGTANQAPQRVAASTGSSDADMTGTFDASMSIESLSDHEYMLHIGVENLGFSFSGFQFDLQLPAGLGVVTDEYGYVDAVLNSERTNARNTDIFDAAYLQDGSLRVLCASTHNMMFADEQGEVLAIRLLADESFEGNGLLALTHICYTATGEGLEAADVMMSFADAITSIQNVMSHDEDFVWDLNGRMVGTTSDIDALPMGIYMINGKKIVK